MPFITEEIWQNLRSRLPDEGDLPESIMIAPYPRADSLRQDGRAEEEVNLVMQVIRAVRNTRAQLHIPAGQQLEAVVEANGMQSTIEEEAEVIRTLSRIDPLRIVSGNYSGNDAGNDAGQDQLRGITLVVNPLVVRLPLEGVVDLFLEEKRLRTELDGAFRNLQRVETLVSNPDFRAKARPEVVDNEEERLRTLTEQTRRLEAILAQLGRRS
jgi:valyl-tRNA synthetase